MSDETLRNLERDPHTPREVLEAAWFRAGLGWHGEVTPSYVHHKRERGVYYWSGLEGKREVLELVYVPGSEVACSHANASHSALLPGCCGGTGRRALAPFYVGRFPVTWDQFVEFTPALPETPYGMRDRTHEQRHHPVVNVSHADALAFCEWTGLRLPSAEEWRWAALGGPVEHECVSCEGSGFGDHGTPLQHECRSCRGTMKRTYKRKFPWWFTEHGLYEAASPQRCVWEGHPEFGPAGALSVRRVISPGSTAPVVVPENKKIMDVIAAGAGSAFIEAAKAIGVMKEVGERFLSGRLVPARPAGASWCGAHDMAGNVYEFDSDGLAHGGSFRTDLRELTLTGPVREPRDDVGFRVALSAS